jgi:hypothetical protein
MKNLIPVSFLLMFVMLFGCGRYTSENTDSKSTQQTDKNRENNKGNSSMNNSGEYKTVEIKTKGMSCSHCENSIKTEISKLSDIKEVIADAKTNTVKVTTGLNN